MSLIVYGIPNCGTVRKARNWLDAHGLEHTFVDLRATPPSLQQVAVWVAGLGSKPMRNTSGGAYRALGPDKQTWDEAQWATAFAADPMLLKRPIITLDRAPIQVGFRRVGEALAALVEAGA